MTSAILSSGQLRLTVTCAQGRVVDVEIYNDRPEVGKLLVGRPAGDVPALVSGLFALCRRAQGAAAHLATQAALGSPAVLADGERQSIVVEAIKEHLRRLLMDWPDFLGLPPDVDTCAGLFRALDRGDLGAVARHLDTDPFSPLFDAMADLDQTDAGSGPRDVATVPGTRNWLDRFQGLLPDDTFCRVPAWDGTPAETGALARQGTDPSVRIFWDKGAALSARLAALCTDLRMWTNGGPADLADARCGASSTGLACVETARGVLVHGVQLDQNGRVSGYRIIAPTEWNFHPNGAFKTQAMGFSGPRDDLERRLRGLALALNPCVSFDVCLRENAHA